MYCLLFIFCVLFVLPNGDAAAVNDENIKLKWPTRYTFEAEKISLTSGLVENIQYWRGKSKSRVDYNKGAVKTVIVKPSLKKNFLYGVKYEVRTIPKKEEESNFVCTRTNGTSSTNFNLDIILPKDYKFEHVGTEIIEQDAVEKFYFSEESNFDVRETVWAIRGTHGDWIPIRYETIKYDTWLGFKRTHDIWIFQKFSIHFEYSTVFDFEKQYHCKDSEVEIDELSNSPSDNISSENGYHVDHIFRSFKTNYNKTYSDEEEHSLRRNLFEKRMRLVFENNSKNMGYKLAINKFADRTPEELKMYKGLIRSNQRESDTHPFPYTASEVKKLANNLPVEFDLRDMGIITPVKDQEECGSCWTFGTTTAIEGALARKNGGRLLRLSNQALLDCAYDSNLSGCNGGNDIGAYRWIMEHGLPTEEEYGPYTNKEDFCRMDNMTDVYSISGYTNVTPYSVDALKVAIVHHGPLSVSINAADNLYAYYGGIYYDIECDPTKLDHEVTLVGYGQRDGEEYWIVKNSWGQNWGVDGYFYLSVRDNNCGITSEPSYPVL